jgi:hypothetical protein
MRHPPQEKNWLMGFLVPEFAEELPFGSPNDNSTQ